MGRKVKFPGQEYTFVNARSGEVDSGILPEAYGLSNEFAIWQKNPSVKQGGCWSSRKFHKQALSALHSGTGPSGLLGRMKYIHTNSVKYAKLNGHAPVLTSPEEMLKQWEIQKGCCLACGRSGL